MGFFSSIGGLFGGSKSSSKSGFGALPQEAQTGLVDMTKQGASMLLNGAGNQMFTPMPQTTEESQAYGLMQKPTTAQGVGELVGTFTNPFQDFITNQINKEATGKYGIYKQALAGAGQMGSNREFINAQEADAARLNAIGNAQAANFNNAQATALAQNQQTVENLMAQADKQRVLDLTAKQAPLEALNAFGKLIGYYPASQESTSENSGGGLLGTALGAFSGGFLGGGNGKLGGGNGKLGGGKGKGK